MPGGVDVSVKGAEDFVALTRRIKTHADAKALRRELYRGLQRATKGTRTEMLQSIPGHLPTRGGLEAYVRSKGKLTTRSAAGGKSIGISIRTGRTGPNLAAYNAGRFRHPVFGRKAWVTQSAGVDPGFLDEAFKRNEDEVRRDVLAVMDDVARKVV